MIVAGHDENGRRNALAPQRREDFFAGDVWQQPVEQDAIERAAPRYYPEFSFILKLPVVREFLTWNCALLISKR